MTRIGDGSPPGAFVYSVPGWEVEPDPARRGRRLLGGHRLNDRVTMDDGFEGVIVAVDYAQRRVHVMPEGEYLLYFHRGRNPRSVA